MLYAELKFAMEYKSLANANEMVSEAGGAKHVVVFLTE